MIVESLGGAVQPYRLDPQADWAIDLPHLESLITPQTRAIVLNNPSNPCGSVLPRENLEGLLAVAARHRLPVIADEIYGNMVFTGHAFHPLGALTTGVPVLTIGARLVLSCLVPWAVAPKAGLPCQLTLQPLTIHTTPHHTTGGLAKQFAVPGWRVGWILLHDPAKRLSTPIAPSAPISAKRAIHNLTQIIIGANTLVQAVIPRLFPTPPRTPPAPKPPLAFSASPPRSRSGSTTSTEEDDEASTTTSTPPTTTMGEEEDALALHHRRYVGALEENARFFVAAVDARFAGRLSVGMPQGAMYAMLKLEPGGLREGLDRDDVAFCARLLEEENVVLLPGQAFGIAGYVRVVLAPPREMLAQALDRLAAFVERHAA